MPKQNYNRRIWLNPETSHFTGSIVCHDGVVSNQGKPPERYAFLELSSCHGKIKLHADKNDGALATKLFINKLLVLRTETDRFIHHLLGTELATYLPSAYESLPEGLVTALAEKDAEIEKLRTLVASLTVSESEA